MRVVIFCGGFGTRMWPASRKSYPKQFYPLIGGKSFFELTYKRFRKKFKPSEIFVSTEKRYTKLIKDIVSEIPNENIIAEPERKDNLAAVGLVTAILEKRFPGETMVVSWSDHLFEKEDEFLKAIDVAGKYGQETGLIVSVNEKPKLPSVHNEWVKLGKSVDELNGFSIVEILETIKRPDIQTAKKMFISDNFLLNTGYRAWRTDVMLSYYKEFQPAMYQGLLKIMENLGTKHEETMIFREYNRFIKDSVEFGIFVKLDKDKCATIPGDFGWKDAGTWELFYKALKTKESDTVLEGGIIYEDLESDRNLVLGPKGKLVSLIGITDLVIIDTPDALLISKMDRTGDVKEIFGKLEKDKPDFVD